MGHNSVIIVYHDALDEIESDGEFGSKLAGAVYQFGKREKTFEHIPAGEHGNAAVLVDTHHADFTTLIAVGGNFGQALVSIHDGGHPTTRETHERLLHELAAHLGYVVIKERRVAGAKT